MNPIDIIYAGLFALQDYLSAHVLTCLIPAFFIAGAIAVFVTKKSVLRYFGANTKKYLSYSIASISGAILAVCSCTVLPLFASIYKRGAGIGPATAFLFSGPAINILAIVLTAQVLGYQIGLARALSAVFMAIVIGLIMAFIFRKEESEKQKSSNIFENMSDAQHSRSIVISVFFFLTLVLILVIGAASSDYLSWMFKLPIIFVLIFLVVLILWRFFSKDEISRWGLETWNLTKKIVPILLIGVFIVGIIGGIAAFFVPEADADTAVGFLISPYLGENSVLSCFLSSIIGAILYIPTLLEVAIVGNLFGYSSGLMSDGPALSLLLAGPSLSLPNMIVITKVMGAKKAVVYFGLVVILATFAGYLYGVIIS